ncbi:MAG: hypothetical protein E7061_07965 [Treponema sp.]|jgi:hypothetical protein|nr:hypothetical protein [Treponema sp.]
MMKLKKIATFLIATCTLLMSVAAEEKSVTNGVAWTDTNGNVIQAHDTVVKYGSKYYWYGLDYSQEAAVGDGTGFMAVKCYESEDLVNWTWKSDVLTKQTDDRFYGMGNVFYPQVVYNKSTKMFVMWMGTSNGPLVAVSDKPYGNFHIHDTYVTTSSGSIINSVFVDDDGAAYLAAYVWEDLAVDAPKLYVYRLTDDYLEIRKEWNSWGDIYSISFDNRAIGRSKIIKHKGVYYLIFADYGSLISVASNLEYTGLTWYDFVGGSYTYQGVKWAYANSLYDEWSGVNSFENTSTSYEFSTLIAVQGEEGTNYIASFNGWNSSDMANSTYTWQPLQWDDSKFSNMDVPYIGDYSSIVIDAKKGTVKGN